MNIYVKNGKTIKNYYFNYELLFMSRINADDLNENYEETKTRQVSFYNFRSFVSFVETRPRSISVEIADTKHSANVN